MATETLQLMVEGGKAVAGAAIAQKLGPLKVNIQDVLKKVNDNTAAFKGMQVPVTVRVDTKTKDISIDVGTPPTSQLIKKELGLEKGSGQPDKEKIANIAIEQCIKIAQMKMGNMYTFDLKAAVKSVAGSCNSLGILIEGKTSREVTKDIDNGIYDNEISQRKTEIGSEKKERLLIQLTEVKERLLKEAAKLKAVEEAAAEKVVQKVEAVATAETVVPEAAKTEEKKEVK